VSTALERLRRESIFMESEGDQPTLVGDIRELMAENDRLRATASHVSFLFAARSRVVYADRIWDGEDFCGPVTAFKNEDAHVIRELLSKLVAV